MDSLQYDVFNNCESIRVTFTGRATADVFNEFVELYQDKISTTVLYWELDFRELEFITSMAIGVLVSMNGSLSNRNGNLRLILKKGSKVASLILHMKLNKLIDVVIYPENTEALVEGQDQRHGKR